MRYAYVRAYRLIENGAEYAAANLRGDCGLQALLFITLCRILGIPARWESGLMADPTYIGSHDWAQFYTEAWGWLPVDCSFGGAGYRKNSPERRAFYLGQHRPLAHGRQHALLRSPSSPPASTCAATPTTASAAR